MFVFMSPMPAVSMFMFIMIVFVMLVIVVAFIMFMIVVMFMLVVFVMIGLKWLAHGIVLSSCYCLLSIIRLLHTLCNQGAARAHS